MSWSVQAIGRVKALKDRMAEEFGKATCMEPEETVRQAAGATIASALAAQDPDSVVQISASGSQSQKYDGTGAPTGLFTNNLDVKVTPVWGFVE